MIRSQLNPMPEYFDRYILMADDVTLSEALKTSLDELKNLPLDLLQSIGDQVYAPGKWTIKDIFQHLIDTERVFAYRALAFSRKETQKMISYDEDLYAKNAFAHRRSLVSLVDELITVRKSFIQMFESFTPEMLMLMGLGFKGPYSVLSIGFITAGHQRWHMRVIEQKYYPLIGK
ncbi:MAG: DinB family protein [Saprospiraceae bacterium]|nr:DinB family protein [Saprospiraceae bacterium]